MYNAGDMCTQHKWRDRVIKWTSRLEAYASGLTDDLRESLESVLVMFWSFAVWRGSHSGFATGNY